MNQAESIVARQTEPYGYAVLVEAFRLALRCNGAWDLAPDGVLNGAGGRDEQGPIVNVRRERLSLDWVHDDTEIAAPRLISSRCIYDLHESHLAVRTRERHQQAIRWPELQVSAGDVQFIEEADIPADAESVRHSSDAGPRGRRRRRGSDPTVVRYGSLTLRGPDGFRAVWHFSRIEAAIGMSEGMIAVGAQLR